MILKLHYNTLVILMLSLIINISFAMTRQQLKNSGKLMKKSCMPKNDVTEEQVGEIEQGKFIEDRNVMCYIACVYSMTQVVKNNKLSYEAVIKQVDMMFPPEMRDAVKASAAHCKDVYSIQVCDVVEESISFEKLCSTGYLPCIFILSSSRYFDAVASAMITGRLEKLDNIKIHAKKYKDICEASYWTAKCMYDFDAQNFVFP